jgi:hypothetical protein
MKNCPKCYQEVSESHNYCGNCGFTLRLPENVVRSIRASGGLRLKLYCPQCEEPRRRLGIQNSIGWVPNYCYKCGHPLNLNQA